MYKIITVIFISFFLLNSCSQKNVERLETKLTDEEKAISIYTEAIEALNEGDAFYAGKKFREVESMLPQGKWASKSSLLASYADYSRNAYSNAIFNWYFCLCV